jgi:hypothetical protein
MSMKFKFISTLKFILTFLIIVYRFKYSKFPVTYQYINMVHPVSTIFKQVNQNDIKYSNCIVYHYDLFV